jgi:ribosomal protein S12 methylthiotransferase
VGKEERLTRFMETQSIISANKLQERINQTVTVLIDEVTPETIYARSAAEAPEIDGMVIIDEEWDLVPGDFIDVKITRADEHDLYAIIY